MEKHKSPPKGSSRFFIFIYIFGVLAAVCVAFNPILANKTASLIFLIGSVSHVLFLSFLGFFKEKDKNAAGNRVQTAGYLHTLVGFTAALLQLKSDSLSGDNLNSILLSIGSALLTSIVGWLLGGELVMLSPSEREESNFSSELENIRGELVSFTKTLEFIHGRYTQVIEEMTDSFDSIHHNQKELLEKNLELQLKFNRAFSEFKKSLESINSTLKATGNETKGISRELSEGANKIAEQMNNVSAKAEVTARALDQSIILIKHLEKVIEYIDTLKS